MNQEPAITVAEADELGGESSGLARAGFFADGRSAADHGLVVLAMGLPYWLEETPDGFGLWVAREELAAVQREFALYEEANRNWPPPPVVLPSMRTSRAWATPVLWAVGVSWVFVIQGLRPDALLAWGALDSGAVWRDGEWWRCFTALFLHADAGHLWGNVVIGVFVFTQWLSARGTWRGWAELTLAAVVANALTAAIRLGGGGTSIGASTAVFAAIGLLTGVAVRASRRPTQAFRWRALFIPLSAGLALLAMLGAGQAPTDVIAHAMGFGVGVALGIASRQVSQRA